MMFSVTRRLSTNPYSVRPPKINIRMIEPISSPVGHLRRRGAARRALARGEPVWVEVEVIGFLLGKCP